MKESGVEHDSTRKFIAIKRKRLEDEMQGCDDETME